MARTVREILGLDPDATEFHIVFVALNKDRTEIAFLTRSMFAILSEGAAGVEIPASDLQEGRVIKPLIRGPDPKVTFAAVSYHDSWFWIDDRDLNSKRGLSFLMTLFTMAWPGVSIAPPVLIISKP
jgi:hypothetical protein